MECFPGPSSSAPLVKTRYTDQGLPSTRQAFFYAHVQPRPTINGSRGSAPIPLMLIVYVRPQLPTSAPSPLLAHTSASSSLAMRPSGQYRRYCFSRCLCHRKILSPFISLQDKHSLPSPQVACSGVLVTAVNALCARPFVPLREDHALYNAIWHSCANQHNLYPYWVRLFASTLCGTD